MLELGLKTLFAYLLGSVMGAMLMGRLRGVDIRQLGSGNAGGTNALRTQGIGFAAGVVVIDLGKALVAVGLLLLPLLGSFSLMLLVGAGATAFYLHRKRQG